MSKGALVKCANCRRLTRSKWKHCCATCKHTDGSGHTAGCNGRHAERSA